MSKDIFARKTDAEIKRIDDTLTEIMKLVKTLPTDYVDDLVQEIADDQGFEIQLKGGVDWNKGDE